MIWFGVETAVEAIFDAVKPSRFIDYAERKLDRPLTDEEREAVEKARLETSGKRDSVKAMRAALEGVLNRPL